MTTTHDIDLDPLLPRACAAGRTLVRVNDSGDLDDEGLRTVWHRAGDETRLRSVEDERTALESQELTFFGLFVEYRRGHGLRTGTAAETAAAPEPSPDEQQQFDAAPVQRVLEIAARLLREARRDYYVQHLLGQINDTLTTRFNRPQTQVYGLPRWRERLRRASDGLRRLHQQRLQVAILVGVGMLIGALGTLALLAFLP